MLCSDFINGLFHLNSSMTWIPHSRCTDLGTLLSNLTSTALKDAINRDWLSSFLLTWNGVATGCRDSRYYRECNCEEAIPAFGCRRCLLSHCSNGKIIIGIHQLEETCYLAGSLLCQWNVCMVWVLVYGNLFLLSWLILTSACGESTLPFASS